MFQQLRAARPATAVRPSRLGLTVPLILLFPTVAGAQTTPTSTATRTAGVRKPPVAAAPAKASAARAATTPWTGNTTREFSIVAKSVKEKTTPTGAVLTISGQVTITSLETKLITDAVTFDRGGQLATAPGKIQFDDVQQTLTADSGTANYKMTQADLKGNVQVAVRTLPEDGTKPLGTLTGDQLSYNWKDRVATVTGNVTLKLRDRTITADKAIYDGRAQTVALSGNVVILNDQGDKLTAPKVQMTLKPGGEEMNLDEGTSTVLKVQDGVGNVATPPTATAAPGATTAGARGSASTSGI